MVEGTAADFVLHVATVLLSAGLLAVSFRAYRKKQSRKFLFVCGAFALFAVKELLVLVNGFYMAAPIVTAVSHALNFGILLLFFYGVIR